MQIKLVNYIPPLALAVVLVLLWQYVSPRIEPVYLVPTPSMIWKAFFTSHVNWGENFGITLYETLSGFALAVVVSIPLAIALVYSKWFNITTYPLILVLQVVPKVAIAPLIFIALGFNIVPRILVVFLIAFFPIVVDSVTGLGSLEPNFVELMHSVGASKIQIFTMARFRNGLPHIFSGLKVAITLALVGAVVAEFVQSNLGLGYLLLQALFEAGPSVAFASLVLLTLMGIILYSAILIIEQITIPWYSKSKQVVV